MNIEHLKYFVLVAESLNITQTAKKLYISQQALSSHISNLEKKLGVKLFERMPALKLTHAGEVLYKKSVRMIEIQNQIEKEFSELRNQDKGVITIGISHTRGRVLIPNVYPAFHKIYPNVELRLKEGNSRLLETYLKDEIVDMVISANHFSKTDTNIVHLLNERLFWVIPNKFLEEVYENNTPYDVHIKDFVGFPFVLMIKENRIRAILDKYFQRIEMIPNIVIESDNIETVFSLAHKEVGITIYPEMFLNSLSPMLINNGKVSYFPIKDTHTLSELVLAYKKERYVTKFEKTFIEICKKQAHTKIEL
jgi:DNA-binding transcriptional LysR family regulator